VAENFLLKKEWRTKSIAKTAVTLGGGQMINRSTSQWKPFSYNKRMAPFESDNQNAPKWRIFIYL
jgi:hypothetical protein